MEARNGATKMKISRYDNNLIFDKECEKLKKSLNDRYQFLVGKCFGLKSQNRDGRYYGKIISIYIDLKDSHYDFLTYSIMIRYKNKKDEEKDIGIVYNGPQVIFYGDSEEEIILEMELTDKNEL